MAGSKDLLLFTREDGRTLIQFDDDDDDDDDDIFQEGLKPAPNLEIEAISQMKGHPNASMSLLKWTHFWGIFSGISFDFVCERPCRAGNQHQRASWLLHPQRWRGTLEMNEDETLEKETLWLRWSFLLELKTVTSRGKYFRKADAKC